MLLDYRFGITNTIILLTSGYFMAESLRQLRMGERGTSRKLLAVSFIGGVTFVLVKGIEYADKIQAGHTLGSDPFFTWYWLLTVFHLMHVVVGLVILGNLMRIITTVKEEDFEAGGIFWHMCDLIWILLFPALYLIH